MTLIPPNVAALIEDAREDWQGYGDLSDMINKLAAALEAAYASPSPARSLPTVEDVAETYTDAHAALSSRPSPATDEAHQDWLRRAGLSALAFRPSSTPTPATDGQAALVDALKGGLNAQGNEDLYYRDDGAYVVVDGDLDVAELARYVVAALEGQGQK